MRRRSLVLLLLAAVAALVVLRRRAPFEYVDVHFDDGATIRLTTGPEAADLLDEVYAVLDAVA
jgi:hypothetical protein